MKPIDPETYVALRLYIDTATAVVGGWLKKLPCDDCEPVLVDEETGEVATPTIYDMAAAFYEHVPWQSVSLEPAAAAVSELGIEMAIPQNTAQGRISWASWVDRDQMIKALDAATPADVRAQLGDLQRAPSEQETGIKWDGADAGGLGWWAVALSAVGVLAWLGRRTIWGFVLSLGAKRLLQLLAGAALAGTVGVGALQFLHKVGQSIAAAGDAFPSLVIGAVAIGGLGTLAWMVTRRRRRRA